MPPTRKELLFAALVMLALPVVGELALRLARVSFDSQLYGPDRELGWVLRPGANGVVSTETRQYVEVNAQGFHDRQRSYEKTENTLRVAVVGNSWTEALQVPIEKNFCSVLEKSLSESKCFAGRRVEVLNFGVAGYSTGQELLLLQKEVRKYHPDLVIVALYPARDIANNVRELNNAVSPERSPYFVLQDGKLVMDDSFRALPALQPQQIELQNIAYQITARLRVLQAIDAVRRFAKTRVAMAAVHERAERFGVDNLEYSIYAPPTLPAMKEAWSVTEQLLKMMRDESKSLGAEFRVVILATRPQVIPEEAKRNELMQKLGVQDLSYADNRIAEFGKREGIPVLTLSPVLSTYAQEHHAYLNGFNGQNLGSGHWNEMGHRLAGEAIASELCQDAWSRGLGVDSAAH